jgi:hypothetical protein
MRSMAGFEFVNITNPEEAKRHSTKVRRHVMKDIGRARRKRKPKTDDQRRSGRNPETPKDGTDRRQEKRAGNGKLTIAAVGTERDSSTCADYMIFSPRAEGLISQMIYPIEMNEDKLELIRFRKATCETVVLLVLSLPV